MSSKPFNGSLVTARVSLPIVVCAVSRPTGPKQLTNYPAPTQKVFVAMIRYPLRVIGNTVSQDLFETSDGLTIRSVSETKKHSIGCPTSKP